MAVEEATRATVDELRRLAWEVAEPTSNGTRFMISATRDQGACVATMIVEPLGSRTSIVVYLGEGCPAP
jgi:prephenate dehydratase